MFKCKASLWEYDIGIADLLSWRSQPLFPSPCIFVSKANITKLPYIIQRKLNPIVLPLEHFMLREMGSAYQKLDIPLSAIYF